MLARIREGDTDAFTQLVRGCEQSLLRIAFRIVGNQPDAEDIRQTVLSRLWQKPESLPKPDKLMPWLHRCVANESISLIRRAHRERSRNRELVAEHSEQIEPRTTDDEEAVMLRNALCDLSPEQRAILAFRFDEKMTVRQIGDVLDQPYTTVHAKLERAIRTLRCKLASTMEVEQ